MAPTLPVMSTFRLKRTQNKTKLSSFVVTLCLSAVVLCFHLVVYGLFFVFIGFVSRYLFSLFT